MGLWKSFIGNANTRMTPEGGLAIRVLNKTGAPSVKGTVLEAHTTISGAVKLADVDDIDPNSVMYDDGVPDGQYVWVVTGGKTPVLYSTTVALGTISRVSISGDGTATAGYAVNEALPTPPFATDNHFREIGHPLEAIGSPGLAMTALHFN